MNAALTRLTGALAPYGTAAAVAAFFFADRVAACPSCTDPRAQTTSAMLVGTVFLSLTPLAFIGAVTVWVLRSDKKTSSDEENNRSGPL